MKDIKDNFSVQSDNYVTYRPGYPDALFEWIYSHCSHFGRALDCATGNGQAAIKLSSKFELVNAIDISINQLEKSFLASNIYYSVEKAEQPSFAENSFDLITVAQALHWFDHKTYFEQMYKVAKPGAFFAAWGYGLVRVNEDVNTILDDFYTNVTGPYWDEERKHIDNKYKSIPCPFPQIPSPEFEISYNWTAQHMLGYLNTWSAVQHYIKKNDINPVSMIEEQLIKIWGDGTRQVTFPIFAFAGHIK